MFLSWRENIMRDLVVNVMLNVLLICIRLWHKGVMFLQLLNWGVCILMAMEQNVIMLKLWSVLQEKKFQMMQRLKGLRVLYMIKDLQGHLIMLRQWNITQNQRKMAGILRSFIQAHFMKNCVIMNVLVFGTRKHVNKTMLLLKTVQLFYC